LPGLAAVSRVAGGSVAYTHDKARPAECSVRRLTWARPAGHRPGDPATLTGHCRARADAKTPGDAAERLCVEQDDGGGDLGPERQVMAGQEAAELAHSLVFRERCRLPDHRSGHARPVNGG
jgi:hypothetical protein